MCGKISLEMNYISTASVLMFCEVASLNCVVLFSGKGEAIETTLAALQVVPEPFRSFANTLVDICAYAGQSIDFFFFFF